MIIQPPSDEKNLIVCPDSKLYDSFLCNIGYVTNIIQGCLRVLMMIMAIFKETHVIIYQPMQFVYYFASDRIYYDYNIQLKILVL